MKKVKEWLDETYGDRPYVFQQDEAPSHVSEDPGQLNKNMLNSVKFNKWQFNKWSIEQWSVTQITD